MAQVTLYIHAQWVSWDKKFIFSCNNTDMTDYGYLLIETRIVEFESPSEAVLRNGAAKALRAQAHKTLAQATVAANEYFKQADDLLCLEYRP